MKIDDAIIDKVLNNGASVEEAGLVAEWFATEAVSYTHLTEDFGVC